MRVLPHCGNSRSRRSMTGAAAGKQNQRLRLLPFRIGQVAVAKRRAALLARLRVARRRLRSEQFRSASMTYPPRCGRVRESRVPNEGEPEPPPASKIKDLDF